MKIFQRLKCSSFGNAFYSPISPIWESRRIYFRYRLEFRKKNLLEVCVHKFALYSLQPVDSSINFWWESVHLFEVVRNILMGKCLILLTWHTFHTILQFLVKMSLISPPAKTFDFSLCFCLFLLSILRCKTLSKYLLI